jgi:hypothetical protein
MERFSSIKMCMEKIYKYSGKLSDDHTAKVAGLSHNISNALRSTKMFIIAAFTSYFALWSLSCLWSGTLNYQVLI